MNSVSIVNFKVTYGSLFLLDHRSIMLVNSSTYTISTVNWNLLTALREGAKCIVKHTARQSGFIANDTPGHHFNTRYKQNVFFSFLIVFFFPSFLW